MPLMISKADILRHPQLAELWKENLKSSDDAKDLDRAISDTFRTNHYMRPLMPLEVAAFTNEKEQIAGDPKAGQQIRKELQDMNAVEIEVMRSTEDGSQMGRVRIYCYNPDWDHGAQ
jgi:hypothetical protein